MSDPRYYPPGLPRTDPLVRIYDLFYQQQKDTADLRNELEAVIKAKASVSVVPTVPSTGGVFITDLLLSAASTTLSPPKNGHLWIVILRQDGAGGRAISWGSGTTATSSTIDTTASTISTFFLAFDKSNNLWTMIGQLSTGMAP